MFFLIFPAVKEMVAWAGRGGRRGVGVGPIGQMPVKQKRDSKLACNPIFLGFDHAPAYVEGLSAWRSVELAFPFGENEPLSFFRFSTNGTALISGLLELPVPRISPGSVLLFFSSKEINLIRLC